MELFLKIHSIIRGSKVNGPGNRFVLWFQGCSKKCPNCYNKKIKTKTGGISFATDIIVQDIIDSKLDGVTISGGEPFDQPMALLDLLIKINNHINQLKKGIIVFTGYTIEEIKKSPVKLKCIPYIDLIIEGRYIEELRQFKCLAGSENQRFIFNEKDGRGKTLIPTIVLDEEVEVHIDENELVVTGFPDLSPADLKKYGIFLS